MGVQEFKCPGCGAKLKWNAAEQKMKCDYCDNTYDTCHARIHRIFGVQSRKHTVLGKKKRVSFSVRTCGVLFRRCP